MLFDVTMPMLDEVMEEGDIACWHRKVGERIEKGEILLDVETDKAVMEVEADASGVVRELLVEEGQSVPCHTVIARIETES